MAIGKQKLFNRCRPDRFGRDMVPCVDVVRARLFDLHVRGERETEEYRGLSADLKARYVPFAEESYLNARS